MYLLQKGLLESAVRLGQHSRHFRWHLQILVFLTESCLPTSISFAELTSSWRVSWELVVSSVSASSKGWGCSHTCVHMHPSWEISQVPDGNSLSQMKKETKALCCLMENLSPHNQVRNYLAGRAYLLCSLVLIVVGKLYILISLTMTRN